MKAVIRSLVIGLVLLGLNVSAAHADSAIRIQFAAGATSTTVKGYVGAYQQKEYVINVGRGQVISVSLFTVANQVAPNNIYLAISDTRGNLLLSADAHQTDWTRTNPATQDYQIQIVSAGGVSDFRLEIQIPFQIKFAPGATSARLAGSVAPDRLNTYFFDAAAGQYITLTVISPNDNVQFTLNGDDRIPLVRSAIRLPEGNTWRCTLPTTQRYYLTVEQLSETSGTNFTLNVTITYG